MGVVAVALGRGPAKDQAAPIPEERQAVIVARGGVPDALELMPSERACRIMGVNRPPPTTPYAACVCDGECDGECVMVLRRTY